VTLAVFSFMPVLIFDLVGIIAGALRLPMWKFLLATYAGRLPRSLIEVYVGFQALPFVFPFLFD
jgi:membrane protein YqaA with SNARE-associated domain